MPSPGLRAGILRNARSSQTRISVETAEPIMHEADADEQQNLLAASRDSQDGGYDEEYMRPTQGYSSPPRRSRRRRHAGREVMHEMEEGGPASRESSSDSSLHIEEEKSQTSISEKKKQRRRNICGLTITNAFILGLFVAIAYGAYQASKTTRRNHAETKWLSNGTSFFAPTTIVVSLDGFRADFLDRGLSPTLNRFIQEGVSPKYMAPSFPSLTFPNHYTLVTGLHPESHGIIANSFWDEKFRETFGYTNREHSMQPKWWYPHPLWETAELEGVPTAIHMWPGSEAHIGQAEPLHIDKYNGSEVLSRKVDRVLEWLDKPGPKDPGYLSADARPQLIAAYVPDVDTDGHKYGPNSTEIRATIRRTDDMLSSLLDGLKARNLTDIVNVVVVSDHGMATTSNKRLLQFEDIADPDLIEHIDGWPHYGLRPKDARDLGKIYGRLKDVAGKRDGFEVYLRENIPERYHFQNHYRIAPLWLFAKTGWAIVTRDEYDIAKGYGPDNDPVYHPRGIHGYDNEHPLMRAIFVARGPAFPHTPGSRVAPFQNIEVYNILCDSLGIEPHPNNGTLRLPLSPVGVHGDATDHDNTASGATQASTTITETPPSSTPSPNSAGTPNPHDDEDAKEPGKPKKTGFFGYLDWLKDKIKDTVGWVKSSFHTPWGNKDSHD